MKTVFITGTSSGIGKATAKLFHSKGWKIIATMRNPAAETELSKLKNVIVLQCDVTNKDSIKSSIKTGIRTFGNIDVLVNNAGYYTIGSFETATDEQIRRQIDTNLLGLINTTKEIIPHFREQKSGTIINLSSIAGNVTFPLQALYHATKWGVEGFSESLQYELKHFNIKIKIIQPGVTKTDFFGRSMTVTKDDNLKEYDSYYQKVMNNLMKSVVEGSNPEEIAQTIYNAATDNKSKLRYLTGKFKGVVYIRKLLPVNLFRAIVRFSMEK
ncbi:MAG: SDR family oxidoreductase [Betaproteobacteria bacterium]|nr:SDR family oxidoreductase [Betaproteobacteria bacterium]